MQLSTLITVQPGSTTATWDFVIDCFLDRFLVFFFLIFSRSTVEPKEEPNEEEKEEAPTAEQPKEEEEGGEGVKAEEETTMEKPEVAEEMKEETPVKSVAAAPKSPEESHELLICTEEQVKLLMIPSLKPKSKYRFWGDNAGDAKPPKKVVSISAKAEKHDEVEEELAKKVIFRLIRICNF